MSNVDNEGLRTLDEIRARRAQRDGSDPVADQMIQEVVSAYQDSTPVRAELPGGVFSRLNPGELEEIEARLKADVEKLINTINALSRRVAKRFNETAEARQDAAAARDRAERAEQRAESALVAEVRRLERILGEYRRDAMERTKVVDQIRQRFGIEPDEDLYEGLCRKVGDLQTSEAELVSAPLKAQIEELTQANTYRDMEIQALHTELAEQRQALKARETEVSLLEVALGDWRRAGEKIAKAVSGRRLDQVMNVARHMAGTSEMIDATNMIDAINDVRAALHRMKPQD